MLIHFVVDGVSIIRFVHDPAMLESWSEYETNCNDEVDIAIWCYYWHLII